jgi:hypothetical protein
VILDNGPGDRVQCSQTNSSFLVSNIQNYLYCFITKNRLETDPSITGGSGPKRASVYRRSVYGNLCVAACLYGTTWSRYAHCCFI